MVLIDDYFESGCIDINIRCWSNEETTWLNLCVSAVLFYSQESNPAMEVDQQQQQQELMYGAGVAGPSRAHLSVSWRPSSPPTARL